MKISRRKFIGLAAAVALLPAELLVSKRGVSEKKFPRVTLGAKDAERKATRKVFIDESGGASDRYRIAGGIVVGSGVRRKLKWIVRHSLGDTSELKWNRLTSRNADSYKAVADAILFALHRGEIDFRYSTMASSQAKWSDARTDIGYSRATEALMRHYAVESRNAHKLYIYPQRRRGSGSMLVLRNELNRTSSNGQQIKSPIRLIEYRDSMNSVPNQVADFLVGALAYRMNVQLPEAIAGSEKHRLAEYISARIPAAAHIS